MMLYAYSLITLFGSVHRSMAYLPSLDTLRWGSMPELIAFQLYHTDHGLCLAVCVGQYVGPAEFMQASTYCTI